MNIEGIEIADIYEIPPIEDVNQKEVFAFFGLASYTGQCLEKGLVNFVMAYKFLDEMALSQDQWNSLYERFNSKTFGFLLCSVKNRVNIPEVIERYLDKALKQRNWITHNFFYDRSMQSLDEEGMKQMISEFREIIYLFLVTDKLIDTVYMDVWASFSTTQEQIKQEVKICFNEYQRSKNA